MSDTTKASDTFTVSVQGSRNTTDDRFRFRLKDHIILARNVVITCTTVRLGWTDRVRALFGRTVFVHVTTPIRVVVQPGRSDIEILTGQTESKAHVSTILPQRRLTMGRANTP